MAASPNDKFKKTANGDIPAVATVQASRASGVNSLSVDTQQAWPTGSGIAFSTYKVDTNNKKVIGSQVDWSGVSNGTNAISGMIRVGGALDQGSEFGDKVQMGPTAQWAEDLIEGLGREHKVTGEHSDVTANSVTTTTLTVGGKDVSQLTPTGLVNPFAGATAPTGWLLCNGTAVNRTTYAALFAVIGSTYGAGDGTTTFNLPDLTGRVVTGVDAGATRIPANNALGQSGGEATHILTTGEMPSHAHGVNDPGHAHSFNIPTYVANGGGGLNYAGNGSTWHYQDGPYGTSGAGSNISIQANGGNGAHNNLQPYLNLNYIIKA